MSQFLRRPPVAARQPPWAAGGLWSVGLLASLLLAGLLSSVPMRAQTPAASPCAQGGPRQFDFWLGEWDVFLPDGSRAGRNRIEPVAGGCALLEQWQGRGGFGGSSLNRFDPVDGRWHQWWVDSSGAALRLSGHFENGQMQLAGTSLGDGGARRHERIRWTPAADGSVQQRWEQSDDGERWRVVFDGRYMRAGKAS